MFYVLALPYNIFPDPFLCFNFNCNMKSHRHQKLASASTQQEPIKLSDILWIVTFELYVFYWQFVLQTIVKLHIIVKQEENICRFSI